MGEFKKFLAEQSVVGLAVGIILGGAVSALVTAFIAGIVGPIIGSLLGDTGLAEASATIGDEIMLKWGMVVQALIDFLVIAAVVFFGVKWLGLDKLDAEKED